MMPSRRPMSRAVFTAIAVGTLLVSACQPVVKPSPTAGRSSQVTTPTDDTAPAAPAGDLASLDPAPAETAAPAVGEMPSLDPAPAAQPVTQPQTPEGAAPMKMNVTTAAFGKTPEGAEVTLYTCTNAQGMVVKLINYGALVVAVEVPDRAGKMANVTLGFPTLDGYLDKHPYFGATVGRYANRIAKGKFTVDGQEYTLATNNGPNHLHGGNVGYGKVLWNAEPVQADQSVGVKFTYQSKDGEEGYPGNLTATAQYTVTDDNELVMEFSATTDKPCPVNLTNHCYWNLAGAGSGTIRDHVLMLAADKYIPVDATLIPTGELADVKGTPFDFTTPEKIGARLDQVKGDPIGYDHCYVLRGAIGERKLAARVQEPKTGRVMEVYTTQPGIQFYSGNFLDGKPANGGYQQYEGFCLETQHFPDSPNQPKFPTTIVKPGETYRHTSVYKFLVE